MVTKDDIDSGFLDREGRAAPAGAEARGSFQLRLLSPCSSATGLLDQNMAKRLPFFYSGLTVNLTSLGRLPSDKNGVLADRTKEFEDGEEIENKPAMSSAKRSKSSLNNPKITQFFSVVGAPESRVNRGEKRTEKAGGTERRAAQRVEIPSNLPLLSPSEPISEMLDLIGQDPKQSLHILNGCLTKLLFSGRGQGFASRYRCREETDLCETQLDLSEALLRAISESSRTRKPILVDWACLETLRAMAKSRGFEIFAIDAFDFKNLRQIRHMLQKAPRTLDIKVNFRASSQSTSTCQLPKPAQPSQMLQNTQSFKSPQSSSQVQPSQVSQPPQPPQSFHSHRHPQPPQPSKSPLSPQPSQPLLAQNLPKPPRPSHPPQAKPASKLTEFFSQKSPNSPCFPLSWIGIHPPQEVTQSLRKVFLVSSLPEFLRAHKKSESELRDFLSFCSNSAYAFLFTAGAAGRCALRGSGAEFNILRHRPASRSEVESRVLAICCVERNFLEFREAARPTAPIVPENLARRLAEVPRFDLPNPILIKIFCEVLEWNSEACLHHLPLFLDLLFASDTDPLSLLSLFSGLLGSKVFPRHRVLAFGPSLRAFAGLSPQTDEPCSLSLEVLDHQLSLRACEDIVHRRTRRPREEPPECSLLCNSIAASRARKVPFSSARLPSRLSRFFKPPADKFSSPTRAL